MAGRSHYGGKRNNNCQGSFVGKITCQLDRIVEQGEEEFAPRFEAEPDNEKASVGVDGSGLTFNELHYLT